MSPLEVVFSEYKVGQVYEVRPQESIMGVRDGGRKNIPRCTAWHYQAADMEICPTLLRVYNSGCVGRGQKKHPENHCLALPGC